MHVNIVGLYLKLLRALFFGTISELKVKIFGSEHQTKFNVIHFEWITLP